MVDEPGGIFVVYPEMYGGIRIPVDELLLVHCVFWVYLVIWVLYITICAVFCVNINYFLKSAWGCSMIMFKTSF